MIRKRLLLLGSVAIALVAFGGCGSSDTDDGSAAAKSEAPPPPEGSLAFASDKGLTVAVMAISSRSSSTTVVFEVVGRDDLGDSARVGEPMHDQNGRMVMPQTGLSDPVNRRRTTMTYNAIPDTAGTVLAQIRRVEFQNQDKLQTAVASNQPFTPVVIEGNWRLEIPFPGGQQPAVAAPVDATPVRFGPGTIELERAAVEGTELVIHGRVQGFGELQIQSMKWSVNLQAADGTTTSPTRFGYGFGDALSGFTLRFAAPPSGAYSVNVMLGAASHPFEPTAVAEMDAFTGQSARMTLDVP